MIACTDRAEAVDRDAVKPERVSDLLAIDRMRCPGERAASQRRQVLPLDRIDDPLGVTRGVLRVRAGDG